MPKLRFKVKKDFLRISRRRKQKRTPIMWIDTNLWIDTEIWRDWEVMV